MELFTTENTKKIGNIDQAPTKCPAGWFSPVLKRLLDHQTEETWVRNIICSWRLSLSEGLESLNPFQFFMGLVKEKNTAWYDVTSLQLRFWMI